MGISTGEITNTDHSNRPHVDMGEHHLAQLKGNTSPLTYYMSPIATLTTAFTLSCQLGLSNGSLGEDVA